MTFADLYTKIETLAVSIGATEMALFSVNDTSTNPELKAVVHVRPGRCSQAIRDAAVSAFHDIARACVLQRKDGAILVDESDAARLPMYCITKVLRRDNQIRWAAAYIIRCRDVSQAIAALSLVHIDWGDELPIGTE